MKNKKTIASTSRLEPTSTTDVVVVVVVVLGARGAVEIKKTNDKIKGSGRGATRTTAQKGEEKTDDSERERVRTTPSVTAARTSPLHAPSG